MPTTNFSNWLLAYNDVFTDKYNEFCELFPEGGEPSYREFVVFIWRNTHKYNDQQKQQLCARIN